MKERKYLPIGSVVLLGDKLLDNDTKSSETGKAVFWNKGFQSAVAA